mmetsp:Transcript_74882/g.156112  ORF Transcript_74882/g.156112 Transcript_74882/m.156112 type:complete len:140 (-) Transcript_74882:96-515(-)
MKLPQNNAGVRLMRWLTRGNLSSKVTPVENGNTLVIVKENGSLAKAAVGSAAPAAPATPVSTRSTGLLKLAEHGSPGSQLRSPRNSGTSPRSISPRSNASPRSAEDRVPSKTMEDPKLQARLQESKERRAQQIAQLQGK